MALTRNSRHTVIERIQRDPAFGHALLEEADSAFRHGEPAVARLLLRDLVHATVSFEGLAAEMNTPSKSLHRMLSAKGNPTMDNLAKIFNVLERKLGMLSHRGADAELEEAPT